jgi:hypothetical protein
MTGPVTVRETAAMSNPPTDLNENAEDHLLGYVFAVAERPFCCWDWDLPDRNAGFLEGLDTDYYRDVAGLLVTELDGESWRAASIALRGAYHQAGETLFSLLGAHVQAPGAVPAWLSKCRTEDLEVVVRSLRDGGSILTQTGRQRVSIEGVSDEVLRHCRWADEEEGATARRFAGFWRRVAADLLDGDSRAEYNSIKHGLRVSPGGFTMSIGVQDEPHERAPKDRMRSLGGSRYGSTFMRSEKAGDQAHHVRMRRVMLNWSAESMAVRLGLISLSIANIVGALRCDHGAPPETINFHRPEQPEVFDEAWKGIGGISSSSMDTIVRVAPEDELSKSELLAHLEARST